MAAPQDPGLKKVRRDIAKVLRDLRGHRNPDGGYGIYVSLTGDRAALIYTLLERMRKLL